VNPIIRNCDLIPETGNVNLAWRGNHFGIMAVDPIIATCLPTTGETGHGAANVGRPAFSSIAEPAPSRRSRAVFPISGRRDYLNVRWITRSTARALRPNGMSPARRHAAHHRQGGRPCGGCRDRHSALELRQRVDRTCDSAESSFSESDRIGCGVHHSV